MDEKLLANIGLNKYERTVYWTLLKKGELEASKLSQLSRVPIGKIYEVLSDLNKYGLVEIKPSRPRKYRTVDTKIAFELMYKRKEEEALSELKLLREAFAEIERQLSSGDSPNHVETIFWPDKFNDDELKETVNSFFEDIEHEICVVTPSKYKPGVSEQYDDSMSVFSKAYLNLAQRGIHVKILDSHSQLLPSIKEIVTSIEDESIKSNVQKFMEIRILETKHDFVIFDSKTLLLDIEDQVDTGTSLGMTQIHDESYTRRFKAKFDDLWTKGKRFDLV
ncbi:helix-turn-helix domain-containing protein [Methanolobus sp. WCC1]|jgi:sugar-specific transcriptional regulator TrmB|uniref:TrmB family transcriptional regulator n=1 Tax=unclassified Methanolobus TaxID=2629569 RepID=UPI0025837262|nr:helix-turn-helix domain-containing protein [Methanolobus sp.]MDK2830743.1 HTH-type transcriptional regulator, sugar sensing transcriptional regulator [Methanolobus sp.]